MLRREPVRWVDIEHDVKTRHRAGDRREDIARDLGINPRTLRQWCESAGLRFDPRGRLPSYGRVAVMSYGAAADMLRTEIAAAKAEMATAPPYRGPME